ncbi:ribokinase [Paenibacillus sp. FSL R5-0407]|uniref:ribokinase n=1 Tax=Paenibacillus sp. FSL R5-0407 TaxID=2975320 RepID=UPI0030F4BA8F
MVIGSFMMDLVIGTERAPHRGETVIGGSFDRFPGGKGANQAVAAARLGADVIMAGKLGMDSFGEEMHAVLVREGIESSQILFDRSAPTGVGSIVLEAGGQNRIIVVPGANLKFTAEETLRLEPWIQKSQILVMQLEMDLAVVEQAAEIASKYGVPFILNPAPARALTPDLLSKVTYLTPNETELELLTGISADSEENLRKGAQILLDQGVGHVVVTLAEKGALIADRNGFTRVEGFPVQALDTVAAGDSFNGALAVELTRGASVPEAVRFANAVGAITVTRRGAIPSLPGREEVEAFLQARLTV